MQDAQVTLTRDRRDRLGLGAFVALSVALHLGVTVLLAGSERVARVEPVALAPAQRTVRVSFVGTARAAPVPQPPAIAPPPETPVRAPRRAHAPPPVPTPRLRDASPPTPSRRPAPKPRPEPAKTRTAQPVEPVAETAAPIRPTEAAPTPEADAHTAASPAVASAAESEDRLARYVAEVRAMIVAQKRYPAMARRRSIEGAVEARIEIGADGSLSGLRLSRSAPRVLSRATEEAIQRAAPFPTPPEGVRVIEIPVDYSLLDAS